MSDIPDLSSDEDQFEEDEWQEMDSADSTVTCLFCSQVALTINDALKHCETYHHFRLDRLKSKFNMDCYSYIKLINFIKTHRPSAEVINNTDKPFWEDDIYLKPVANDEWLMFDFESILEHEHSPQAFHANVENGLVTLSQAHFTELQRTIQDLSLQVKDKQELLDLAKKDIEKMKNSMKVIVDGSAAEEIADSVLKVSVEDDEGYFQSYSHFGIHYEMLSDKVRTESYMKAILDNTSTFQNKVVLDLGCGTGILSMFAAKAGAKKVYAIDQSEIIFQAMDIVRENGLQDVINLIKGKLEKTNIDEKVDIIVSEWMGYFLLFEGMLDSVIYARDKCLKHGGILLPNRCNISLVANGDLESHNNFINYWSDVYGFKMNCMKTEVVKQATINIVHNEDVISKPCIIKDIDLNSCSTDIMDFKSPFSLTITKDGSITSLVGYFDTFFDLPNQISFSTGPQAEPTHWKQTVFYFKNCFPVMAGDIVNGTITCNRLKSDVRGMAVKIELFGKVYEFLLN